MTFYCGNCSNLLRLFSNIFLQLEILFKNKEWKGPSRTPTGTWLCWRPALVVNFSVQTACFASHWNHCRNLSHSVIGWRNDVSYFVMVFFILGCKYLVMCQSNLSYHLKPFSCNVKAEGEAHKHSYCDVVKCDDSWFSFCFVYVCRKWNVFNYEIFLASTSSFIPCLVLPWNIMHGFHRDMIAIHVFVTEVLFANTSDANSKSCW